MKGCADMRNALLRWITMMLVVILCGSLLPSQIAVFNTPVYASAWTALSYVYTSISKSSSNEAVLTVLIQIDPGYLYTVTADLYRLGASSWQYKDSWSSGWQTSTSYSMVVKYPLNTGDTVRYEVYINVYDSNGILVDQYSVITPSVSG